MSLFTNKTLFIAITYLFFGHNLPTAEPVTIPSPAISTQAKNFPVSVSIEQTQTPVKLTISTEKKTYFQGEVIPVNFFYEQTADVGLMILTLNYDRSGRLGSVAFAAERATDKLAAVDPIADSVGGWAGGVSNGPVYFDKDKNDREQYNANEWVWFPDPGVYDIVARSWRITVGDPQVGRQAISLDSNTIQIEIVSRTPEDTATVVAQFKKELYKVKHVNSGRFNEPFRDSCNKLRYLHDPDLLGHYLDMMKTNEMGNAYYAIVGIENARELLPVIEEYGEKDPALANEGNYQSLISNLSRPPRPNLHRKSMGLGAFVKDQ